MVETKNQKTGHMAKASVKSIHMSPKHAIEICSTLRYKTTNQAKKILMDAISLKKAIPFKRFNKDMGHKRGMAAGRYAPKAASEVLKLVKSVEANAQDLGLDTTALKISKILANRAARPMTGGRNRGLPKRTHVEIEVVETQVKKKVAKKKKVPSQKAKETTKNPASKAKSDSKDGAKAAKKEVSKPVSEAKPETKVEAKESEDTQTQKTKTEKEQ